jgi:hypothetical protein
VPFIGAIGATDRMIFPNGSPESEVESCAETNHVAVCRAGRRLGWNRRGGSRGIVAATATRGNEKPATGPAAAGHS